MATWDELSGYVRSAYKVYEDRGDTLSLVFETPGGRSQLVVVQHSISIEGTEFATIASSFAQIGKLDYATVLREVALYTVGGVVAVGDQLLVRHAVPLAFLELPEFEGPLYLVLRAADALEKQFTRSDAF